MVLGKELQLVRGDQGESGGSGQGFRAHVLSELGCVSLESFTLFGSSALGRTDAHNTGMDAAGDAVLLLDVDLGQMEVLGVECKVVFNVSL